MVKTENSKTQIRKMEIRNNSISRLNIEKRIVSSVRCSDHRIHLQIKIILFGTTNDSRVADFVGAFASTTYFDTSQFSDSDQRDLGIQNDTEI